MIPRPSEISLGWLAGKQVTRRMKIRSEWSEPRAYSVMLPMTTPAEPDPSLWDWPL